MAKKKGITPTTIFGGTSSTLGSGTIYTGNSSSANNVIITTSGTGPITATPVTYHYPSYSVTPHVTDGFYEDDGRLFWKNSKGEVFQVTFTKQETVNKIINDL